MEKIYMLALSVFVAISFTASTGWAAAIYLWDPSNGCPSGPSELHMTVSPCPSADFTLDVYLEFVEGDDTSGNGPYAATLYVNYGSGVSPISSTIHDVGPSSNTTPNFDSCGMPGWSVSEGSATDLETADSRVFFGVFDYYEFHQLGDMDQYGQYKIGSVTFHCDECGITTFTTSDWDPESSGEFLDWNFTAFDDEVTFHGGIVSQVPIPGTLLLLGSGVVGMVLFRKKSFGGMV